MSEDNDNLKEMPQGGGKQPRTAADIRKAIENQLREAKVKEATAKAKKLIEELAAARKVVEAKEAEITQLFEEYGDVIPQ